MLLLNKSLNEPPQNHKNKATTTTTTIKTIITSTITTTTTTTTSTTTLFHLAIFICVLKTNVAEPKSLSRWPNLRSQCLHEVFCQDDPVILFHWLNFEPFYERHVFLVKYFNGDKIYWNDWRIFILYKNIYIYSVLIYCTNMEIKMKLNKMGILLGKSTNKIEGRSTNITTNICSKGRNN